MRAKPGARQPQGGRAFISKLGAWSESFPQAEAIRLGWGGRHRREGQGQGQGGDEVPLRGWGQSREIERLSRAGRLLEGEMTLLDT